MTEIIMMMQLNAAFPTPHYQDELKEKKLVSVSDFLKAEAASRLRHCLQNEVPWGLAYRLNDQPITRLNTPDMDLLPASEKTALQKQLKEPFQFVYNTYMMVTAYIEQRDPELLLHKVLEWLNSEAVLNYFRALTGVPSIKKINAQATRYLPGHFLKSHNDSNAEEGRRYAYVLSLTKNWQADWGGLLHFTDTNGRVTNTLVPAWNTLNVFQVPQDHFVSYVAPFAEQPRLAITGWLLDK